MAELAVEAEDIDAELGVRESWVSTVGISGGWYCIELLMDSLGLASFCSEDEAEGCAAGGS